MLEHTVLPVAAVGRQQHGSLYAGDILHRPEQA